MPFMFTIYQFLFFSLHTKKNKRRILLLDYFLNGSKMPSAEDTIWIMMIKMFLKFHMTNCFVTNYTSIDGHNNMQKISLNKPNHAKRIGYVMFSKINTNIFSEQVHCLFRSFVFGLFM
jgi:hypothetical protein